MPNTHPLRSSMTSSPSDIGSPAAPCQLPSPSTDQSCATLLDASINHFYLPASIPVGKSNHRTIEKVHAGSVELTLGGHTVAHPLEGKEDFGEERISFAVPEFTQGVGAQIRIKMNGHSTQSTETLTPQKKWTLYMVPHVHLDVGYTDYQAKVSAIQGRILDEAMDLTVKHPDFRFSTDGEWNLDQFLKLRTPAEQQRILTSIKNEHIYIPAQSANLLTGFPTAETLIRSLYPSANFSREHGTPLTLRTSQMFPRIRGRMRRFWQQRGFPISWRAATTTGAGAAARTPEREHAFLVGGTGWRQGAYVVFAALHADAVHVWAAAFDTNGRRGAAFFLQMYQHASYRANAAICRDPGETPISFRNRESWRAHEMRNTHFRTSRFLDFTMRWRRSRASLAMRFPRCTAMAGRIGKTASAQMLCMRPSNARMRAAHLRRKSCDISTLVNPHLAVNRDGLSGCGKTGAEGSTYLVVVEQRV